MGGNFAVVILVEQWLLAGHPGLAADFYSFLGPFLDTIYHGE